MYDAMTDLYSILPIGHDKRGKPVPLLRKPKTAADTKPGLTGGALERRIDRWARNPLYNGSMRGATGRVN